MQTIGERLEEARKRMGVSIREAAEATKIRGEYLQSFEGNKFDLDLANIYLRGFLRNYATFLKISPERILNDYESLGRGDVKPRQPSREVYGRMDLSVSSSEDRDESPTIASAAPAAAESGRSSPHLPRGHSNLPKAPAIDPALVFKGGIALAVIAVLILIVVGVKSLVSGGSAGEASRAAAATASVQPVVSDNMTFVATAPVRIKVARQSDGVELFQTSLAQGERRDAPNEPLFLTADALQYVQIEFKGKLYNTGLTGYKKARISAFPE
jgi:transcriptional regulator with XRE-family HTH domain